jgi:hypothetical protein
MSTKTTFKRVALVAVASLGFGVLTSIAPASATAVVPTALSAGTSSPSRIGAASVTTITVTHPAAATAEFTAAVKVTTAPATSKAATDTNTATLGATIVTSGAVTGSNVYAVGGANMAITNTTSPADATNKTTSFKVSFVADVAGTYTLLVSTGASAYAAGNASTVVTITTAGAPTAMKVASIAGAVVEGGNTSTGGQLIGVTLTDANGNATVLTDFEGINVTTLDTTVGISNPALAKGEDTAGTYIIRLTDGGTVATGSAVISFSGTGLLPATLTTNMSATKIAATASTAEIVNCTTAANCSGVVANTATGALAATVSGATSLTITGVSNATASAIYHLVAITDNTGAAAVTYDSYVTVAAGTATVPTITTSITAPAATEDGTVVLDFGPSVATMTYQEPAAKTLSVADSVNSVLSATAGTNKFTAKVVDQYGTAVANHSVSVSVSGRNTVAAKTLGLTDANGLVSFSITDAGTTGTRDTVTFTATVSAGGTGSAVAYVNYGTVTVDSVTVSGGSKAETIAGSTLTAIKAGDNGPEGSAVAIKAVVKDASGNLLAGVPVTFTVDAGAIKKTAAIDYATVYTGSDGSASTSVFNWISGKQTITATAGGKSSTDYLTWAANDATSARVLSATATGDIVSLKVVDRFGNAVQGVTINLSRTGAGLFGNGASTQNIDTDKNGTADVRFIGSGTVVAELAATYAQAYAAAGNITTKAATAATAGTTAGTGATLTPAGVAKVSVAIAEGADPVAVSSQAAADAAAEATDAANAATDAANAAAEAADAATAAAQDAADAVAALSTQVTELVSALRKQITSLTNLVIKIQKKVRA